MLWLKALHVAFMVTWFAGLFYLPRLFVYHVDADDAPGRRRFVTMERRLFMIMTIGALLTIASGLGLLALTPSIATSGWFHVKTALVLGLIGYHAWCGRLMRALSRDERPHGTTWLRWFNELPGLALLGIVLLAVVKPF